MLVFLGVLVALVALFIILYNQLQSLKIRAEEAWADIDTQLKKRYDLIPNLVETVKGYAGHEKETLERVIQARNTAIGAQGVDAQARAESGLAGALKSLFALSESYPDLKANQNFMSLQNSLSEIEDAIQRARQYYNAVVRDFNIKIRTIPSNLVAALINMTEKAFFELEDEAERAAPKVQF